MSRLRYHVVVLVVQRCRPSGISKPYSEMASEGAGDSVSRDSTLTAMCPRFCRT